MSPIISNEHFYFNYDTSKSVDENFTAWRIMNHEERSAYGEALHTFEEGLAIFEKQYSVKVSSKNGWQTTEF